MRLRKLLRRWSDENHSVFGWSRFRENKFVNMLVDESLLGNLFAPGNQHKVMLKISKQMSNELGRQISLRKVIHKYKSFRMRSVLWDTLNELKGFKLNSSTKVLEAREESWASAIEQFPMASMYRYCGESLWMEFIFIFGGNPTDEMELDLGVGEEDC